MDGDPGWRRGHDDPGWRRDHPFHAVHPRDGMLSDDRQYLPLGSEDTVGYRMDSRVMSSVPDGRAYRPSGGRSEGRRFGASSDLVSAAVGHGFASHASSALLENGGHYHSRVPLANRPSSDVVHHFGRAPFSQATAPTPYRYDDRRQFGFHPANDSGRRHYQSRVHLANCPSNDVVHRFGTAPFPPVTAPTPCG